MPTAEEIPVTLATAANCVRPVAGTPSGSAALLALAAGWQPSRRATARSSPHPRPAHRAPRTGGRRGRQTPVRYPDEQRGIRVDGME